MVINKIAMRVACVFLMFFFATSMACPPATSSGSSTFCSSFKLAAECHCTSSGLPKGMCMNMTILYNRMIGTFGTLQRACEFQHDTTAQICMDDWNCYRFGGTNAQGELCNATGMPCA